MKKNYTLEKFARRILMRWGGKVSSDWMHGEGAKQQVASDELLPPAMRIVLIIIILMNIPFVFAYDTRDGGVIFVLAMIAVIDLFVVPMFIIGLIGRIVSLRKRRNGHKL